jgi:hypothetical protein
VQPHSTLSLLCLVANQNQNSKPRLFLFFAFVNLWASSILWKVGFPVSLMSGNPIQNELWIPQLTAFSAYSLNPECSSFSVLFSETTQDIQIVADSSSAVSKAAGTSGVWPQKLQMFCYAFIHACTQKCY